MEIIVILVLVLIGFYLFKRAQRVAREEQLKAFNEKVNIKSEQETVTEPAMVVDDNIPPLSAAVTPATQDIESSPVTVKAPVEPLEQVMAYEPEIADPIIDVQAQIAAQAEKASEHPAVKHNEPELTLVDDDIKDVPLTVVDDLQITDTTVEAVEADDKGSVNQSIPQWASDKLQQSMTHYLQATTPDTRLLGLTSSIKECYKLRKQAQYSQFGCELYQQFDQLVLENQKVVALLSGEVFMQLSTLLSDNGQYAQAIALCEQAQGLQLTDGTVTGFEGRITRIKRSQAKAMR